MITLCLKARLSTKLVWHKHTIESAVAQTSLAAWCAATNQSQGSCALIPMIIAQQKHQTESKCSHIRYFKTGVTIQIKHLLIRTYIDDNFQYEEEETVAI